MKVGGQSHALTALPWGKDHGTHWIECWVDPRTGPDMKSMKTNPCPCQELNSGHPARLASSHTIYVMLRALWLSFSKQVYVKHRTKLVNKVQEVPESRDCQQD